MLDECTHPGRHALRKAALRTRFRQMTQVRRGCLAFGHQFGGIAITQFLQGKGATFGDAKALFQQSGGIDAGEPDKGAQVALAIGLQGMTAMVYRGFETDGSDQVLQRFARSHMHVHIACRHHRQAEACAQCSQQRKAMVVVIAMQFGGNPHATCEMRCEPTPVFFIRRLPRHPQQQTAGQTVFQIGAREMVFALGCASPRAGDEAGEAGIALGRRRERHHGRAVGKAQFAANDEPEPTFPGSHMGAHHACEGTFVGERQGGVTQFRCALHQFLRVRGPAQEGEVGQAMQLGVGRGGHGRGEKGVVGKYTPVWPGVAADAAILDLSARSHGAGNEPAIPDHRFLGLGHTCRRLRQ